MDAGILIGAIFGSAGLFSFLEFLVRRHDHKRSPLKDVQDELKKNTEETMKAREEARQFNLRITRMELFELIKLDPENKKAILEIAYQYFIELDGDLYMHDMFETWANEYNVSTIGLIKKGDHHAKRH